MTVKKPDRNLPDVELEVQNRAYELFAHTAQCCSNEHTIPKRLRWCIGHALVDATRSVCRNIDIANTMRLDREEEKPMRRKYQALALGCLYNVRTELHLAWTSHHFDDDKLIHWLDLIKEVEKLLKSWMKSEA